MENAGYVVTGWVLTGAVLLAYALDVARRTRRAARTPAQPAARTPAQPADRTPAASRVIPPSQRRFYYARKAGPDR